MIDPNLLSRQGPEAMPWSFLFDTDSQGQPREWPLFPLSTLAIAQQLERWVFRHVAANIEKLRPDPDDQDPVAWRVYREYSALTRRDLEMGTYGAFTDAWLYFLENDEAAIIEAIFQCVRFKEPAWTREHVRRLRANRSDWESVVDAYRQLNFPKKNTAPSPTLEPSNATSQSPGEGSSNDVPSPSASGPSAPK